jgi:predicted DNA-binding transcriptional regulator AlpA
MTRASSATHNSRIQRAAAKVAASFVSTHTRSDAVAGSAVSEMFTTPEAAAYTKMAVPTLERFRLTGEGPMFAKLGGSVRYRRCDLDAWIESRLVRSTSQTP